MDDSNGNTTMERLDIREQHDIHEAHKRSKQERRLLERLKEAREAEVRARDRFQRAQDKLQRREARVTRLERRLDDLRTQLAAPATDQQGIETASANGHALPLPPDSAQDVTLVAIAPEPAIEPEPAVTEPDEATAQVDTLEPSPQELEETQEAPEVQEVQEVQETQEVSEPQDDDDLEILEVLEILEAPEASIEDVEDSGEIEPYVTPRLRSDIEQSSAEALLLELAAPVDVPTEEEFSDQPTDSMEIAPEQPVVELPSAEEASMADAPELVTEPPAIADARTPGEAQAPAPKAPGQALAEAREEWNMANAAVHLARNRAHDMAASISTLVQTGLSGTLMEELLRKQAEANRALTEAQQNARVAYEQLIQAEANFQQRSEG